MAGVHAGDAFAEGHGEVHAGGNGRRRLVDGVDLAGEAAVVGAGGARASQLVAGEVDDGIIILQVQADGAVAATRVDLDGVVAAAAADAGDRGPTDAAGYQ